MAWRQAIIWNTTVPIHWRIYAALGQDGLICKHLHETHIFTQNVLMKKCRMLLKMLSIGVLNDVQLTWCDCLSSFLIWTYWKQRRIYRNYTLTIEYLHVIITRTNGARWGPFKTCLSDFEMHPRVYGVRADDPLTKLVGSVRGTSLIHSSYRAVCGVVDINSIRGITIEGLSWKRGISWWRHRMETLLSLWEGNPPVIGGFPSQRASSTELWCFLWCLSEQAWKKRDLRDPWYVTLMQVDMLTGGHCRGYYSGTFSSFKSAVSYNQISCSDSTKGDGTHWTVIRMNARLNNPLNDRWFLVWLFWT